MPTSNIINQKVNKVCDEISKEVKECKRIGSWHSDRLYNVKKTEFIDKNTYKMLSVNLQKYMSGYINKFREEKGNIIETMEY